MKNKIIVLVAGILFYILFVSCNSVEPNEYSYDEDYTVYSKAMSGMITEKDILIVLKDSTQQESFIQNNIQYFIEHFPEANRETMNNYLLVNQRKVKLQRITGINFVFQSEYDKSVKNVVNVYLSNVGFNSDKTEAFVSIGALYAPLAGSGSLIFLVKINNEWQIRKSVMTWIS